MCAQRVQRVEIDAAHASAGVVDAMLRYRTEGEGTLASGLPTTRSPSRGLTKRAHDLAAMTARDPGRQFAIQTVISSDNGL